MTVEDTIWGKRFEEYVSQMLSVFGFEKITEQPIFKNGESSSKYYYRSYIFTE